MKRILKIFFLILFGCFFISLILYQTYFVHWGLNKLCLRTNIGCIIEDKIHFLFSPFNLNKVILKDKIDPKKFVDLKLKVKDLLYIQEKMKYFSELGFIEDSSNEWRNAKILIDEKYEKVEYKFHGTSIIFKNKINKFFKLLETLKIETEVPITKGTFSLKIKHDKDSNYNNNLRQYNLISLSKSSGLDTIAMNRIAASMGLLAEKAEFRVLRINGIDLGLYLFAEGFREEWFEREHRITNYSLIKSIDDWDTRNPGHMSDQDLMIEYKEIRTAGKDSNTALVQLEKLFIQIENKNIEAIKRLVDTDDLAKYLALFLLYNNNHPLSGDNLKYVYNLSEGKFRFIFRIEDKALPWVDARIDNFNRNLLISPYPDNEYKIKTLKLFKLLIADENFRLKRDEELQKIINNLDNINNEIDKTLEDNKNITLVKSDIPRKELYKLELLKEKLKIHASYAKKYLDYNKVYITRRFNYLDEVFLSILNDSFDSIELKNIKIENSQGDILIKEINKTIPAIKLDSDNLLPIPTKYKLKLNIDKNTKILEFTFINNITKKEIKKKHIYYNKAFLQKKDIISENIKFKNITNLKYITNDLLKTFHIYEGVYEINEDLITPYGYDVIIEPGVKLLIAPKKSFLIRGGLLAEGTDKKKILVMPKKNNQPFGTFAIYPNDNNKIVSLNYFNINGGSEDIIDGVYFSGQISIHKAKVFIKNSSFYQSASDDGINIKSSQIDIHNSSFYNNFGDQIDLDFCEGKFESNDLSFDKSQFIEDIETDGLDISGSNIIINYNKFSNFTDKGISVGEESYALINENIINESNTGIAIKDSSVVKLSINKFNNNDVDIHLFIKKKMFSNPVLYFNKDNQDVKIVNNSGTITYE